MNYPCSEVVHLDPYNTDPGAPRALRYCTRDSDHEGDHVHEPTGETKPNEKQRGTSDQEDHRAAETNHQKEAVVMSHDTAVQPARFRPGDDVHIMPGETDIDGTYYPAEHLRRSATLSFTTEECEEVGSIHTYDIFAEDGEQVHAIKLVLVDEMNHTAELTLSPVQVEQIGEWMQQQAQKLIPGGDSGE